MTSYRLLIIDDGERKLDASYPTFIARLEALHDFMQQVHVETSDVTGLIEDEELDILCYALRENGYDVYTDEEENTKTTTQDTCYALLVSHAGVTLHIGFFPDVASRTSFLASIAEDLGVNDPDFAEDDLAAAVAKQGYRVVTECVVPDVDGALVLSL